MTAIPRDDLTPDWIDQVAIDRAMVGHPVGRPLHAAERRHITRVLVGLGHGASQVARICRCSGHEAAALVKEATPC